jgi:hypothetical protein
VLVCLFGALSQGCVGRQEGTQWFIESDNVASFVDLMAQGTSSTFMNHGEKDAMEDSDENNDGEVDSKKVWAGTREVDGFEEGSTMWDDNLQSAASQLLGTAIRKEQREWSKLASEHISSKTANNRVNDNAALSVFPALQAQHGAREVAYTGTSSTAGKYAPHKSRVRICLYENMVAHDLC